MTSLYDHIACCVDDSAGARHALRLARRLRALGPGRLTLVHATAYPRLLGEDAEGHTVVDPRDPEVAARRWLNRLARREEGEHAVLVHGVPTAVVRDWAREAHPDLLVVGAYRNAIERALLGSFASYLAHRAPCPVLMVRPDGEAEPEGEPG